MAFSDFQKISEVQERFRVTYTEEDFVEVEPFPPSSEFLRDFEFTREYLNVFSSEASRCETIIFPVLKENYKAYADQYALWIKQSITYDDVLNGTPDYFVSTRSELGKTVVGTPLILLVEAKKNDFEQGWGQCLAELVAVQKIKAKNLNGSTVLPVYGIVTDGTLWQFGRLIGNTFTQNRTDFTLANLSTLFGAVDSVFKEVNKMHEPLQQNKHEVNQLAIELLDTASEGSREFGNPNRLYIMEALWFAVNSDLPRLNKMLLDCPLYREYSNLIQDNLMGITELTPEQQMQIFGNDPEGRFYLNTHVEKEQFQENPEGALFELVMELIGKMIDNTDAKGTPLLYLD